MSAKKNYTKRVDNDDVERAEPKGKFVVRCTTPPVLEQVLNDISSKVDVIFDKTSDYSSAGSGESRETYADSYEDMKADHNDTKSTKMRKRMALPNKKTVKTLENMESKLKSLDNTTMRILDGDAVFRPKILQCCRSTGEEVQTFTNSADLLLKRVEKIVLNLDSKEAHRLEIVDSHFKEQQAHLAAILKKCSIRSVQKSVNKSSDNDRMSNDSIESGSGSGSETEPVKVEDADDTEQNIIEGSREDDEDFVVPPRNTTTEANATVANDKVSCEEVSGPSGIYTLGESRDVNAGGRDFYTRYCEASNDGGWTVIQRRDFHPNPRQNFSLTWEEYKHGFGDLAKEFWFGNEYLHRLTNEQEVTLRVQLEDFDGNTAWAEYSEFRVETERDKYKIKVAGYSGNATDSFGSHNGAFFSTWDNNNDDAPACCRCAPSYGGGWWFNSCFEVNLNGPYHDSPHGNDYFRGIIWEKWLGNYSLRKTVMLIRGQKTDFENQSTEENLSPLDIPDDP